MRGRTYASIAFMETQLSCEEVHQSRFWPMHYAWRGQECRNWPLELNLKLDYVMDVGSDSDIRCMAVRMLCTTLTRKQPDRKTRKNEKNGLLINGPPFQQIFHDSGLLGCAGKLKSPAEMAVNMLSKIWKMKNKEKYSYEIHRQLICTLLLWRFHLTDLYESARQIMKSENIYRLDRWMNLLTICAAAMRRTERISCIALEWPNIQRNAQKYESFYLTARQTMQIREFESCLVRTWTICNSVHRE